MIFKEVIRLIIERKDLLGIFQKELLFKCVLQIGHLNETLN